MTFPSCVDIAKCFANKHKNEPTELVFSLLFYQEKSDKN